MTKNDKNEMEGSATYLFLVELCCFPLGIMYILLIFQKGIMPVSGWTLLHFPASALLSFQNVVG